MFSEIKQTYSKEYYNVLMDFPIALEILEKY